MMSNTPLLIETTITDLETSPRANTDKFETAVYKRRWVVLIVFMLLSILNNLSQYSFSSITQITREFYSISDFEVDLLAVVYFISGFTTRFGAMWLIDNKGLGTGIFVAATMNLVGCWLRYFPGSYEEKYASYGWLITGQSICAIAQSFIDIAGPKIAANWFPPRERTTATALSSGPLFIAVLMSYSILPHTVTSVHDVPMLLFAQAIIATVAAVLVYLFFRGSPPIPPSYSAATEKLKFGEAFRILFKKRNFLILFVVFAITLGSAMSFSVLMDQVLKPEGYSNKQSSSLGSIWVAFAILGGFIGGPIIDRTRAYKAFIILTLGLCTLATTAFTVTLMILPDSFDILCVIVAVVGLGAAGVPAILEATIETIYPVPEATAMGILFLGLNVTGVVFVLLMEQLRNPHTGSMIPSMWMIVALCVIGTALVFAFKGEYRRLSFEQGVSIQQSNQKQSSKKSYSTMHSTV